MSRVEVISGTLAEAGEPDCDTVSVPANQLVLQHYDREHIALRRYLLLTGIDDATAQEIVQETFLKLHSHLARNGERTNLRAWLYRVAHNLALNEHAAARRRQTQALDVSEAQEIANGSGESPESLLLQSEREMQLRRAMQKLSLPQRECLLLRTRGMKYREIAAALEISVASVGENIQRGLEQLKGLL